MDRDLVDRLTAAVRTSPVAGIVSAYLFGSHVGGLNHKESDIDLGILFDRSRYGSRAQRFDAFKPAYCRRLAQRSSIRD